MTARCDSMTPPGLLLCGRTPPAGWPIRGPPPPRTPVATTNTQPSLVHTALAEDRVQTGLHHSAHAAVAHVAATTTHPSQAHHSSTTTQPPLASHHASSTWPTQASLAPAASQSCGRPRRRLGPPPCILAAATGQPPTRWGVARCREGRCRQGAFVVRSTGGERGPLWPGPPVERGGARCREGGLCGPVHQRGAV